METFVLGLEHKDVEPRDEASPTGFVRLEHAESSAVLLTPEEIDPERRYPLITVLHGAGRQDELLVKACRDAPEVRQAFFLIPRSVAPTWDLIAGNGQPDFEFLRFAYDLIYRRYPIDAKRQALIGYSDGASYGLSLALSNPGHFDAAMCWAAGFVVVDRSSLGSPESKPRLYLEYGTHDQLFSFEEIAIPMRDNLRKAGYAVEFSVDEGGRHMPSGHFQNEALDWYFDRAPGSESV
jgi:phospholipase/carboxylesterase